MTLPDECAPAPALPELINQTVARFTEKWRLLRLPVALGFPRQLEAVYEAETRQARIRELYFTAGASAGFVSITALTDRVLIPDLGWTGLASRLIASAVVVLAISVFGRVSGRMREMILFVASYIVVSILIGLPCLSRSMTAPYQMFLGFLAVMYTNTTTPFRFRYAWPFSLLCVATIAAWMHYAPTVSGSLAGAMLLMGGLGVSYTLLANYRMERGARVGYLLASKEAMRLLALNRDRDELTTISNTDALTCVANRGHFDRRLTALFEGVPGQEIHLIMLDVDFFKRYNDRYGHPTGDACLCSIAAVLKRVMRGEKDFAFRYGGEEFGALLIETSKAQAEKIAERIRGAVQDAAIEHGDREDGLRVVTVSIGVAHATVGDGSGPVALIAQADRSLYASKKGGRNRVSVATAL